jgi:hypothetical protein
MLSSYTNDFLEEIYKLSPKMTYGNKSALFSELKTAEQLSRNIKFETNIGHIELSSLMKSEYGVKEIKKYIKEKQDSGDNTSHKYNFIMEDSVGDKREVEVSFVDYLGFSRRMYDDYARRVFMVLYLLRNTNNYCSKTLKIFIYMTPFKKLLPESRSVVLSSNHINTGVTYQCIKNNEICVYRQEEWFKVFIHELFHAYGMDMNIAFSPNMFYTGSKIRVGEAYVEFWAVYLNSAIAAYYSAAKNVSATNKENIFSGYLAKYVRAERIFTLIQVNKILRHNNVKYNDMFNHKNRYREKTNVFAYFILKSLFLFHYEEFIKLSIKNNKNMYYVVSPNYIKAFIEKKARNREYIKYLNLLNVEYMKHSLRMTIVEME